jgi:hypothetical protein
VNATSAVMESVTTSQKTRRIPAALLESLQEVCYRQDVHFLHEVSKLIGVSVSELKQRILGKNTGFPTTVLTEEGPWWEGTQCIAMEKKGSIWFRCSSYADSGSQCWMHRRPTMTYNDPMFTSLPQLTPTRIEGRVVWVDKEGLVYNEFGEILKEWLIDLTNGHAYYGLCMASANASKQEDKGESKDKTHLG